MRTERSPLSSWQRRLLTVVVLAAVVSPAIRDQDSYPLSTYPVYATARDRTGVLHTAVGIGADQQRHRLSLDVIAATDDPLIAEDRVADAVRDGRSESLCGEIAKRAVEAADRDRIPPTDAIEIVAEQLDFVLTIAEDAPALTTTVHARCELSR